jgi:hypothetical protein
MKPTTLEWIHKAEEDWHVAQMSYRNPFAVAYRYPGIIATRADAKDALTYCREVRGMLRAAFGLPV